MSLSVSQLVLRAKQLEIDALQGLARRVDLADFIGCFFAVPSCPQADFNGAGGIDADDLPDYIGAYFLGC